MDSRYRRYSSSIPKYLLNRPHGFVKHCLQKIAQAKNADLSGVVMKSEGEFYVHSFKGYHTCYTVNFGDNENMPSCTCPYWNNSMHLCKHFFAVFLKYPNIWSWDALSTIYKNSPFLTLDVDITEEELKTLFKEEEFKPIKHSQHQQEILNQDIEQQQDIEPDTPVEIKEMHKEKSVQYGPMARDVLSQLRSIFYELDNDIDRKLYTSLSSILSDYEKLRKKENNLPILPQKRYERSAFKFTRLSLNRKRQANRRIGIKNEKMKKARILKVEEPKKQPTKKIKEQQEIFTNIVDNEGMGKEDFKTKLEIVEISSGDDELVLKDPPSFRRFMNESDLEDLSNNRMLTDKVLHTFQMLISKKFPMIEGLQDPIIGEQLAFTEMKNRPFLQVGTNLRMFLNFSLY